MITDNQTDPGNSMTLKTYPSMGQMGGGAMMGTIARHNAGTMASCKTLSACSKQCNGSTMGPAFYYPANYSATVRGEGQLYPNPTANGEDDRQHTYEDPCKLKVSTFTFIFTSKRCLIFCPIFFDDIDTH